ncbi:MAG: class I SAM-dependent methyltransferase [Hormoscilla sp. SP12CHS1]|nr:class I SAM-dependent methyltransferase [Hormoscilla sp. SP12CHS1]
MDLVLYHPQQGYYSSNKVKIGKQGDFFTSANLCADLGELLAVQFAEMWDLLARPTPFTLVEMGAGEGLMAADILPYLQKQYSDCFGALEYIIVEKAPGLKAAQQQRLQNWPGEKVRWCSWEEIPPNSVTGCFFCNELLDAFPVHQIIRENGQLREIYVTIGRDDRFIEVIGELSTPQIAAYFALVGINLTGDNYPEGYRSEVNLAALDWVKTVASSLRRGYLLAIDYGYRADKYYHAQRSSGTLQCYYRHQRHHNPYLNVGHQDITAHVDFTALERQGKLCGLEKLGKTQQGLFLMALGLGDRLQALSTAKMGIEQVLQRRDALHQLIDPMGLGGFGVLVQTKGLSERSQAEPWERGARSLLGLSIP